MIEWIFEEKISGTTKSKSFNDKISAGLFLSEKQKVILGYTSGNVKFIKIDDNRKIIVEYEYKFKNLDNVRTIKRFKNDSIVFIGTLNSGNYILINVDNYKIIEEKVGEYDKYNRIFCSKWLNHNIFLVGSTYGNFSSFNWQLNKTIEVKNINGHGSDSIFGIDCFNETQVISGGYKGRIKIWAFSNNQFRNKFSLQGSTETIQAIAYHKSGENFATLGKEGTIQIFKKFKENEMEEWVLYLKYYSGSGVGNFIEFSNDGNRVFALTQNDLIILDINTTGIYRYAQRDCYYFYELSDKILIINKNGIFQELIKEPTSTLFQRYNYSKVSIIGDTETGKTTLCNAIVNDSFNPITPSTEMRNIWDWEINEEIPIKIVLHDFGGQKNIVPAHFPYIIDSDLIIIVYSQRNIATFEIACEIRDKLISEYEYKKDFLFIQTHCDQNDTISESIKNYNFTNKDKIISPIKTRLNEKVGIIEGINELKTEILKRLKKIKLPTQILAKEDVLLISLIKELQEAGKEKLNFYELYTKIKEKLSDVNPKYLFFALKGLSVQGRLELRKEKEKDTAFLVHPENIYVIYLNMKKIFSIKNKILQIAYSNKGIIDWKEYIKGVKNGEQDYYNIAIEMLEADETCLDHQNQKIFFDFIKEKIEETDGNFLKNKGIIFSENKIFVQKQFDGNLFPAHEKWISMFLDLNLTIGIIAKLGAVFYYTNNNAYCYVFFQKPHDIFSKDFQFCWYIDGKSEEIKKQLNEKIYEIYKKLFGLNVSEQFNSENNPSNKIELKENSDPSDGKSIKKQEGNQNLLSHSKQFNSENNPSNKIELKENSDPSDGKSIKKQEGNQKLIYKNNEDLKILQEKICVFISYFEKDLETFTLLKNKLISFGYIVKEAPLKYGDKLINKILIYLSSNNFGYIIISRNFLELNWKKTELTFITTQENNQGKLQPILINIDEDLKRNYDININNSNILELNTSTEIKELKDFQLKEDMIRNYIETNYNKDFFFSDYPEFEDIDKNSLNSLKKDIKIILFTAVNIERDSILKKMEPIDNKTKILRSFVESETYFIGKLGLYNIVLTMCSPGSVSRDGIILASNASFDFWKPKIAILCGICFGVNEEKQKIGDILISSQVINYEKQRLGEKIIFKGPIVECSSILINRFSNITGWKFNLAENLFSDIHIGPILSGEKLFDNILLRNELLKQFPQAIGGEMEGIGLYASADRKRVDWIVIKSICDWGYNKNKNFQPLAADSVVAFIKYVFQTPNIFECYEI